MSSSEQFGGVLGLFLLFALICGVVLVGLFVYVVVRLVRAVVCWVRERRKRKALAWARALLA
jgi:uncharacterized protein (DUF2062 family)